MLQKNVLLTHDVLFNNSFYKFFDSSYNFAVEINERDFHNTLTISFVKNNDYVKYISNIFFMIKYWQYEYLFRIVFALHMLEYVCEVCKK